MWSHYLQLGLWSFVEVKHYLLAKAADLHFYFLTIFSGLSPCHLCSFRQTGRPHGDSDLLNLPFITLKIRIASHLALRHWDAKSMVKFLSFQAVESALPMWCLICSGHGILTFAEQLNKQIWLPHNRLQWGQIVLSAILKYGLQQSIFFDDSDSWCC